ncbi:MAG: protein kinase domain-containing protein [Blastocatellia bacterium]
MDSKRWEQIGRLYDAAQELTGPQRTAFLSQACAGDDELRREIESLFAAESSAADFMATPALREAAQLLSTHAPGELIGRQFGHYQLLSLVGAGGMGEVYAARDTRLGRRVAIKLLPASIAADAMRSQRFEQEARAISRLNHPNILTIHDVGQSDGVPWLVSELLEGETLRQRMQPGPLPLRAALDFARQIISGLTAAHEKGVIHRDLKPENLFVIRDGLLKILDFGLAKLIPGRPGDQNPQSVIRNPHATDPGMVMGTAGYMAPEQVRGENADPRADIFAFGVILHEMVTGERPFRGGTAVETLNAILNTPPPALPEALRAQAPALERIIHRCLEKEAARRFQTASDLGFALESLAFSGDTAATRLLPATPQPATRRWLRAPGAWAWLIAGALALSTSGLTIALWRRPAASTGVMRLTVAPPEKIQRMSDPVISPDGRRIAFTGFAEGKMLLWVRTLDSTTAQPLPGTDGASAPFWAPDSQTLGFFAQGKLRRIALNATAPVVICDVFTNRGGGSWNRNGDILFVPHLNAGVHRVLAAGGAATPVTTLDAASQQSSHLWPAFLPGGRRFLYFVTGQQSEDAGLYMATLDGGQPQRILSADSHAVYVPGAGANGWLLYIRAGALLAQPFDAAAGRLAGEPARVAEPLDNSGLFGRGGFSASDNGVLVYNEAGTMGNQQLTWLDRAGKPGAQVGEPGGFLGVSLSADGTRALTTRQDRQTRTPDVWLVELQGGADRRLTDDPGGDMMPLWSPRQDRLARFAWMSTRDGAFSLYLKEISGGAETLLLRSAQQKQPTDWTEQALLYQENDQQTHWDLWMIPLSADGHAGTPAPLLRTRYNETNGRASPDGRWLAWVSDESGANEIYVQAFSPAGRPANTGQWRVSTRGGNQPRWSPDGRELFYQAEDGKLMRVAWPGGEKPKPAPPEPLFDLRALRTGPGNYTVSRDGQKFLVAVNVEQSVARPFNIIVNWPAALAGNQANGRR